MANPTITAEYEPYNVPPRTKITVTDAGTPAISMVGVTRTINGVAEPVRTTDGNPLRLTSAGSTRVGIVYYYEAPFGVPVTYSTTQNPASTATSTATEDRIWLIHPGIPELSQPILLVEDGEQERDVVEGVFKVIGRRRPVVTTDGSRASGSGTLKIRTQTEAQRQAIDKLIDDAGVLYLNVPVGLGWGIDSDYYALGSTRRGRTVPFGPHPYREWTLPYRIVDRPEGGGRAERTLADVLVENGTLAVIKSRYATLADLRDDLPIGG